MTLALVPNRDTDRYSGVRLASDGRVTGFAPRGEHGSYHFVGPQVVEAGVFAPLPAGRPAKSIGGVYDDLLAQQPGALRGFVSDVPYWDVGTVEAARHAHVHRGHVAQVGLPARRRGRDRRRARRCGRCGLQGL